MSLEEEKTDHNCERNEMQMNKNKARHSNTSIVIGNRMRIFFEILTLRKSHFLEILSVTSGMIRDRRIFIESMIYIFVNTIFILFFIFSITSISCLYHYYNYDLEYFQNIFS
jgi:hypothetical protein